MEAHLKVLLVVGLSLVAAGSAFSDQGSVPPNPADKAYADVLKFMSSTDGFEVGKDYRCETSRTESVSGTTGMKVDSENYFPGSFLLHLMECSGDDFMCGTLHKTRIDLGFMESNMTGDREWTTRTFTGLAGEYYGLFAGQLSLLNKRVVWTKAETQYDESGNTVTEIIVQTAVADCSLVDSSFD